MKSMINASKSIVKFFALSLLLVAIAAPSFAQKNKKSAADKAHIKYTITAEGGMAAAMTGSTVDLFFTDNNVKVLANMMSGMMKIDVRMDNKKKTGIMLMDMMGQKKVMEMGEEDLKNTKETNQKPPEIVYLKKYKKIAGYKCQEAHLTVEGMDDPAIVYVTDKIQPADFGDMNMMKFTGLKGFPLSWKVEQQGTVISIEATEVSTDKIAKSTFDMKIPEGYEKMEMDDFKNLGGTLGM